MMRIEIPPINSIGVQPRGANSCRGIQRSTRPVPIHHNMPLRNLVELVTDSTNSQHVARVLGIRLELLAQAVDVWIDVALIAFVIGAPNAVEQRVSGPGPAGLRREQFENLKLQRRQINS